MRTLSFPSIPQSCASRSPQSAVAWAWGVGLSLPLVLAMALTGCTSTSSRWVKDGLSPSLADAKYDSCRLAAEKAHAASNESEDKRAARIRRDSHSCMKADGWSLTQIDAPVVGDPSGDPAPKRPVRLAQAHEPAADKTDSKTGGKTEIKGEVHVSGKTEEGGGDDEE